MPTTDASNEIIRRRWQQFMLPDEPSVCRFQNYKHVQRFIGGHYEFCSRADVDSTDHILIVICDHRLEFGGLLFISIMVIYLSIYY